MRTGDVCVKIIVFIIMKDRVKWGHGWPTPNSWDTGKGKEENNVKCIRIIYSYFNTNDYIKYNINK